MNSDIVQKSLTVLLALVAVLCAPPGFADRLGQVDLTLKTPVYDIGSEMVFILDDGQPLNEVVARLNRDEFSSDFRGIASKGRPYQPVWGAIILHNTAPDDGREGDTWIVASDTYGLVALQVIVLRPNGVTDEVLAYSARDRFQPEHFSGTRLRSNDLILAPGEKVSLLVRQTFGPTSSAKFTLESPREHLTRTFSNIMGLSGFYAFVLACLMFYGFFTFAMKQPVAGLYAVFLTLWLVFLAYLDGLLFRLIYPGRPGLHLPFGLVLLYCTIALGFVAAGVSVRVYSTKAPRIGPMMAGAVLALVAALSVGFLPAEILAPLAYGMVVVMLVAQVWMARFWDRLKGAQSTVFRGVTLFSLIGAIALVVVLSIPQIASVLNFGWALKGVYGLIAAWILTGLSLSLMDLRVSSQNALERELSALKQEAETATALLETERQFHRAEQLAAARQRRLAEASHDIRQPLAALRLNLMDMSATHTGVTRERMGKALDYLDELSVKALEETRPSEPEAPEVSLDLGSVLSALDQMFRPEIEEKGLRLSVVESSGRVQANAVAVMRIASNLIVNAAQHTQDGGIVVGVRSRGRHVLLCVCDTGPGMTQDQLDRLREAYQKGASSKGEGLGLAICYSQVEQNGLKLKVFSRPDFGTTFQLELPRIT